MCMVKEGGFLMWRLSVFLGEGGKNRGGFYYLGEIVCMGIIIVRAL